MANSILLVISRLSGGGAERVISELANAWAEKTRRVGVLTLWSDTPDHYVLHRDVRRFSPNRDGDSRNVAHKLRNNIIRSLEIRRATDDFSPDVVISFVEQINVRVLAALLGKRVPVIVSERIDPRRYRIGRFWQVARRILYPSARALVVQTERVATWARTIVSRSKIHVIANPLRALPHSAILAREKMILGVGRLDRQKGFDLLLQAFAESKAKEKGWHLVILGEGPERNALHELAGNLGLLDHLDIPGLTKVPEEWMSRASIFVLPSRFEGFPNALIEAMAMGCAVIAADCDSGPREIIRQGQNGVLVPPEDVKSLTAAIVEMVSNPGLQNRLGSAATLVRDTYGMSVVLAQWDRLIETCLSH